MSYGQCCLVSNIEENTDVIKEYGYSFITEDVCSLKKELEYLIDRPDKVEDIRKVVKDYVQREFDWDVVSNKTEEAYKMMVS